MASKGAVSVDVVIKEGKDGLKKLTLDADALRKIMESNIKVAQRFEKKVFGFAALTTGINAVNNAFAQLSSTLSSITGESAEFSKAMREANTMAGKDSAGFKQLKGEVADLAKEIPIARDQLANGLYQTISNGVPENNWIEFLNTSARSAVGGLADINKVVGVTSTLIKNYGLEWSAAADIQDKIQLTAKNGVTSFEQLAQALLRVAGNASTLGVTIDELMGTFATLTGVSGNTAEVSTQLAAIFTALVKPSSEAGEMAEKMGIQFDAAAIKAAGGFQNFLTQLDRSVKTYSQANGVLEQEVYGRLFGSAEALRALIPLQGELSDKFAANVSNMVNSAGTMDAAYADMSSHGEAVTQMLRNQWAAVVDVVSGITSAAQPYINFTAGLLSTGSSAAILITTFKQLNIQQTILATRSKLASIAMVGLGLRGKSTAAVVRVFSSAVKNGAYSATALKIALRGLLVASGIGIAIAAVTAIIEHFVSATDDATESTNKFLSAEERAKRDAEQLEQLRQQEASTLTQTRAALEMNISRLKEFNGTKEQEKKLVNEMNNTYGDTMGYFSSVADWYNALISNSEAYCRQMVIEARTRMLANQIAEKEQETRNIVYDDAGNKRKYSKRRELEKVKTGETWVHGRFGPEKQDVTETREKVGSSDWEMAQAEVNANIAAVKNLRKQMQDAAKDAAKLTFSVRGKNVRPNIPQGDGAKNQGTSNKSSKAKKPKLTDVNESATTLKEINDNISFLQEELQKADIKEAALINKEIAAWEKKAEVIKAAGDEVRHVDAGATTLQAIEENISILQDKLRKSTEDNAEAVNKEIIAWEKKAETIRNVGKTTKPVLTENAKSLKEINENIQILQKNLEEAKSIEDATDINKQIAALNNLAEAYRSAGLSVTDASEYISQVGSVMGSMSSILGEAGGSWLSWAANICQSISQALPAMRSMFNALQAIATGSAMAENSKMGPFGWISGIAAVASVMATFASIPKFADGGIISGPTVGLMGEYAGASNNPEVVAPLDKLRSMMAPAGAPVIIGGTLRASGRELVCVLANETRIASKSGKRTNIKI